MAEEAEKRLPCLLDRLIDESPGHRADPASRRTILLKEYRNSVLRDLRWLLNSPKHLPTEALYDYPEVVRSVLNYGTRDLAGMTSSSLDSLQIESDLRDTILNFEPRIIPESLHVRLIHTSGDEGKIAFEINGQLWAFPHAERVLFRTEMDLESGACDITDAS
jgi:type VI secretion system protein ImpF